MDLVIGECSFWCNDIILYIYKRKLNRWTISLPTYILQRPSTEEKESYHFQTLHISYFPKVAADDVEKSTKKIWRGSSCDTDTIFMSLIENAIFQLTFVTLFLHHNFNNNIRIPTPDKCVPLTLPILQEARSSKQFYLCWKQQTFVGGSSCCYES